MDEEDGRLGPQARQTGHGDVPRDAFAMSLCHPENFIHKPATDLALGAPEPALSLSKGLASETWDGVQHPHRALNHSEEKYHENVPGK